MDGIGITLIAAGVHFLLIAFCLRPYMRILRNEVRRGGGRLQFSVSDCCVATTALFPTAWVAAQIMQEPGFGRDATASIFRLSTLVMFTGSSQITGIIIALATNIAPSRKARNNSWSAAWVFFGALLGLLTPLIAPFLIAIDQSEERTRNAEKLNRVRRGRIRPRALGQLDSRL